MPCLVLYLYGPCHLGSLISVHFDVDTTRLYHVAMHTYRVVQEMKDEQRRATNTASCHNLHYV